MPETYAPVILKRRAQKLRKETGDASIVASIELEETDIGHIVTVVLTRPIRMICFEPLVLLFLHPHLLRLRHLLHLLTSLPNHLDRHLRLQRRRRRPHLPPDRHRRRHRRRHLPMLGLGCSAGTKSATSRGRAAKRRSGCRSPASRGRSSCSRSSGQAGRRASPSPGSCPPSPAPRSASATCAC